MKGFRNHYRRSMPLTEKLAKDVRSLAGDMWRWLRHGGTLPVIVAWPDYPSKKTTLSKIAAALGMRLTNKPVSRPSIILHFEDSTTGSADPLLARYPGNTILNAACTDISKDHTDEVHGDVFGYGLTIDPTTFTGKAVQKSSTNALHDGKIIDCPIARIEPGQVYQRVIDNQSGDHHVVDYRVPVIGGAVPLAYAKYKRLEVRFTNQVERSELLIPSAHFSPEELHQLGAFARAMGADFCELDVLRHTVDGRIYVVDLNKTPYGPPAGLSATQHWQAVQQLTVAFSQLAAATRKPAEPNHP